LNPAVQVTGNIVVKLYDATYMGKWKVGTVCLPLSRVALASNGILRQSFPVTGQWANPGTCITLGLEWVPLDGNPVPRRGLWGAADGEDNIDESDIIGESSPASVGGGMDRTDSLIILRQGHEPALPQYVEPVSQSFAAWMESQSQLDPAVRRSRKPVQSRLTVRVLGTTMLPTKISSFCEIKVHRFKTRQTGRAPRTSI
jgi:hypothetical protein